MQLASLFSAPGEQYLEHISRCRKKFELIIPIFNSTIVKVVNPSLKQDELKNYFLMMILFHDVGKLTKRWQENVGTNRSLPAHAPIGASYLWKILPEGIREPLSFAVAIHHTDKGLLSDNIERPDVQAILDGITDFEGNIVWYKEVYKLDKDLFPESLRRMNIYDLKEMAIGLRVWAKGCGILEQHQRRLQASLAHHILKLCDISAAIERKEYQKRDDQDYYGGWLMVHNIYNYIENIKKRGS